MSVGGERRLGRLVCGMGFWSGSGIGGERGGTVGLWNEGDWGGGLGEGNDGDGLVVGLFFGVERIGEGGICGVSVRDDGC